MLQNLPQMSIFNPFRRPKYRFWAPSHSVNLSVTRPGKQWPPATACALSQTTTLWNEHCYWARMQQTGFHCHTSPMPRLNSWAVRFVSSTASLTIQDFHDVRKKSSFCRYWNTLPKHWNTIAQAFFHAANVACKAGHTQPWGYLPWVMQHYLGSAALAVTSFEQLTHDKTNPMLRGQSLQGPSRPSAERPAKEKVFCNWNERQEKKGEEMILTS